MNNTLPPFYDIVFPGACIKVYLNEKQRFETSYAAGIATGFFNANNQPVLKPVPPERVKKFDFYLGDTKVAFECQLPPEFVVCRSISMP